MPSEVNAGIVAGLEALIRASGEPVTYFRGAKSVAIEKAGVGETRERTLAQGELDVSVRLRDFLIWAEELVIGGCQITPRTGDSIVQVIAGKEVRFTVGRQGDGDGEVFRYVDKATRLMFRIHTEEE